MEDIKSYTAYAQKLLERAIEQDVLEGRFEIKDRIENKVTVRDYFKLKDAEVLIKQGKLYCMLDQTGDCDHVGFVLSDPSVIKRVKISASNFARVDTHVIYEKSASTTITIMPQKGWMVVTIRKRLGNRIRQIVNKENKQKSEWERNLTLSSFVENALIQEIKRKEKRRKHG